MNKRIGKITGRVMMLFGAVGFPVAGHGGAADQVEPSAIVSAALDHSPSLKAAGQEVEAAAAQHRQAGAQMLPSADVEARAAQYEGLDDSVFGPTMTIPAIDRRYSASASVTQPLFTGGRLTGQKKSAGFLKDSSEANRNSVEADVILDALTAYWNWSKAYYMVDALESAVSWMEAHGADMHNQLKAGLVTENDALATDVQLDRTRLQLEEARRRVSLARAQIAYLTGEDMPEAALPIAAAIRPPRTLQAEEAAIEVANSNRAERAARRLETRSAEESVKTRRAGFYPQINLKAAYEQARPNPLNIPPADEWQYDAFIGAGVSWNILDWGLTRAHVAEAVARLEQARLRMQQTDESIVLQVRQARINLMDAFTRLSVAERAEKSATLNLSSAEDLWKNGMARHSDVLDAQARLTDSQYETIAARADTELADAALNRALGLLMGESSNSREGSPP